MPIRLLDDEVIARIAAGEVVERPASVAKELLENALDAGSSQIAVEVKGGGISLLRVTDNGSGIKAADAAFIFKRHATSKLSRFEDLQSIGTMGFRGEALASIAAVAEIEITSCAAGQTGVYLALEDGKVVSRENVGRAPGTTVTVRNLFRKVPARLKFLKSANTESSHVANVVSQYALAFPEVKFTLSVEGKTQLSTAGQGRLLDSLVEVYGAEVAQNMLELKDGQWEGGKAPDIKVSGMVGAPGLSRSGRSYLSFFVNRRWVNSRNLTWAVEEAYRGLLMTGKHPVAVINVSLPPGAVDVNIHPAKSEVKFQNESAVFGAVQKAVRGALIEQAPVPKIEEVATAYAASPRTRSRELWKTAIDRPAPLPMEAPQPMASTLPVLRVLGQVLSAYVVCEGPEGLYLIDQHAAHERVLFEKVKGQMASRRVESQGLLDPVSFEVSPGQDPVLRSHCADLADFGFVIEAFGDRTYLVRSVPHLLYGKDWSAMLRELLDAASGGDPSDWREKVMATIACHSAVRAGQKLSDEEMRGLVREMEQVSNHHTCPHGRPTMIQLGVRQIEKEFGRG